MTEPLHDIARLAVLCLETEDGVHYTLPIDGATRLERTLRTLFDKPELRSAVTSLITIAKGLEDARHIDAAKRLLAIASTACHALRRMGDSASRLAEDVGRMTQRVFAQFSGSTVAHTAPVQGARRSAEPGTVTVAAFTAWQPRRA